eukprot:TRINITY_DN4369_c0_g1_i1.p1 TRINITY_DN4369_c0_g1~~TRINITY_DN4369_c0_g1_i1.p1  ORF type:complete len:547 (+),score=54.53 TRINITY_DN4369_c0_g1_i1:2381-4021(+)
MAILRNDLYTETTRVDAQRAILDVTGPIDTSYIPLSTEVNEPEIYVKEMLLANINEKIILLLYLSNEDMLLYEGYQYEVDSKRKEDLPLRFKRMVQGNELVQLKEVPEKDKALIGKRFNILKDNYGGNCVLIIGVMENYWLFVGQRRVFLHKGYETKQIRSAAMFNTPQTQNAYLLCEEDVLKICKLQPNVIYQYQIPFQRRTLSSVPTKILFYATPSDDEYIVAVLKEWSPVSFQVSAIPQTLKQQGGLLLTVLGEKFRYSIVVINIKDAQQIKSEVKAEEGEIINTISILPLKITEGTAQYLMAGMSKISAESIEAPTTGRLVLYRVNFSLYLTLIKQFDERFSIRPVTQIAITQEAGILAIQPVAGYAAVSIGPKVAVYQYDDRANLLRSLAEYEGKVMTTCISSMRGFMICGDYLKGLSFVRFKEDDREEGRKKAVDLLAEENSAGGITATEFWIDEFHPEPHFLGLLSADDKGFVQIFAYFIESSLSWSLTFTLERNLEVAAEINLNETVCKFVHIDSPVKGRNCVLYCTVLYLKKLGSYI